MITGAPDLDGGTTEIAKDPRLEGGQLRQELGGDKTLSVFRAIDQMNENSGE
jgi:hypothetical protein